MIWLIIVPVVVIVAWVIIWACTRNCPICEGTKLDHKFNCPYGKP